MQRTSTGPDLPLAIRFSFVSDLANYRGRDGRVKSRRWEAWDERTLGAVQRQPERHGKEHAHLLAGDRQRRAVVPTPAAGDHAAARQLLDPAAERAGRGNVGEEGGRAGRRKQAG